MFVAKDLPIFVVWLERMQVKNILTKITSVEIPKTTAAKLAGHFQEASCRHSKPPRVAKAVFLWHHVYAPQKARWFAQI